MFEIDKKIAHLTERQINEVMEKYYGGEKAKDIIKEYGIDIPISKLYTVFPPLKCENEICEYCGHVMYQERQSKTSINSHYTWNKPKKYCLNCGHEIDSFCGCEQCQRKRNDKEERLRKEYEEALRIKRELICRKFSVDNIDEKSFNELTTRERILLGALMCVALSEDMTKIENMASKENNLAPTVEHTKEIIKELLENKVILVDPDSEISAFSDDIETFDIYKVQFLINLKKDEFEESVSTIFRGNYSEIDKEEILIIWKEMAISELLEYLITSMERVNFNFNPGKKTIEVFNHLLNNFSVSQIYQMIYNGIAKATKYYQEGSATKQHAANSVITNCQSYGAKAILDNWRVKGYYRDRDCKESVLSQFLFSKIIKIGDAGFNTKPSLNAIE